MDVFGREPGRFLWRWRTFAVAEMVVSCRADGRCGVHHIGVAIRKCCWQARVMKKSKLLADIIKDLDKPPFDKATNRKLLAAFAAAVRHEPVYEWLLANHAEVERLRTRRDRLRLQWETIALIMAEDGVIGSRGAPPNANSVRRVWKRVSRDKIARDARKAEKEA
jgi:hypothetical protein